MSLRPALPAEAEQALFDVAHTRGIEARAAAVLPPHTLMARAGTAVARLALALAPHAQRVWVAAGPGNNGGDGLEAAALLQAAGKRVELSLLGDASSLPADAREALVRARAAGVNIVTGTGPAQPTLSLQDIAIDALLGIGATRASEGRIAEAIRSLNALACPVLAVDLPSGLGADTGQPLGADCVVAAHTLSLLTLKPGLFTGAGRDHAGEVWFDELDCEPSAETPQGWLSAHGLGGKSHPPRRHVSHKGSFGDVAVVGGAPGMTGAALLAARAAHAAGAGRVFVELLEPGRSGHTFDPVHPELMFRHGWSRSPADLLAHTTVVCGCGGGDSVRTVLPRLLSASARLVLDADALNAIAADAALTTLLRARADRQAATVLTPHPLEAARLLGSSTAEVQADRLRAARLLAERLGCVVVLKGSGSVIAEPSQAPRINTTGNASLATAGTGDVLAGWLGGLWAQSASGTAAADPAFRVAVRAVWEHGAAAHPLAQGPMRAVDLIEAMHRRRC